MKRTICLFGLIALLPAALAPAPAQGAASLDLIICNGQANAPTIRIPLRRAPGPGPDQPCCVKGCHASSSRKRLGKSSSAI